MAVRWANTDAGVARCADGGFCRWDYRALAGSCIHRCVHLLIVVKQFASTRPRMRCIRAVLIVRGCSVMAKVGVPSPVCPVNKMWLFQPRSLRVHGNRIVSSWITSSKSVDAMTRAGRCPDCSRPRVVPKSAQTTVPARDIELTADIVLTTDRPSARRSGSLP